MKSKAKQGDSIRKEQTFYGNGQIESEVTYVGEDIEGTSRQWHANGILKEETPMKKSKIHGVVRSWDYQGNLLDESRFKNGSGVFRSWTANGQLTGETHLHEGIPHGRLRAWDEEEVLLIEHYFIAGKKVSKKSYLKACETDTTLPIFDKGDGKKPVLTTLIPSIPPSKSSHKSLADFPDAEEALRWLRYSTSKIPRRLGELSSDEESFELVKEFVDKVLRQSM